MHFINTFKAIIKLQTLNAAASSAKDIRAFLHDQAHGRRPGPLGEVNCALDFILSNKLSFPGRILAFDEVQWNLCLVDRLINLLDCLIPGELCTGETAKQGGGTLLPDECIEFLLYVLEIGTCSSDGLKGTICIVVPH